MTQLHATQHTSHRRRGPAETDPATTRQDRNPALGKRLASLVLRLSVVRAARTSASGADAGVTRALRLAALELRLHAMIAIRLRNSAAGDRAARPLAFPSAIRATARGPQAGPARRPTPRAPCAHLHFYAPAGCA